MKFSNEWFSLTRGSSDLVSGAGSEGTIMKNGVFKLYTGTPLADVNDAIGTQVFCGYIALNCGAFTEGVTTNGLVWATPTVTGTGASKISHLKKPAATLWGVTAPTLTGVNTPTFAIYITNAGTKLFQVTVSDANGTGELKLSTVSLSTGTEAQVADIDLTQQAAA